MGKVEMRDVDRRAWNDVASCKESTVTVQNCGIEIGHEYVFRVTAYNAAGESETSETSTAIEAMDRFVKPRLDKELLGKERDLTAGQMMRLEAVVEAQPPAKFQWFRPNGEPVLHDNDRILIDNEKNKSVLTYRNMERDFSGGWKVVAKNSESEDEHEIRVKVVSPPLRPSGAVEVTKVTPTGATVMWKKPKDDGGSPITGYIVEKKDVEKDYWSPCGKVTGKMANVMKELECDVTDLVENFVYVFRVYAQNAIGDGTPLMSMMSLIPKDEEEEEGQKEGQEEDDEAPKQASVPVPKKAKEQEYVEYCSGWMVAGITEDDTPEIKIDMLTEGYKYQFRVKAQNKAGFSYPSETSEEIVAKMKKQKPQIERVNMPKSAVMVKGDNLTMKVKVQGEPITDKSWYWGRREIKASGSVNIENTDYMSRITIFALERADTGTFSFKAENEHGSAESSLELVVQVAPNKPRGPLRIDDVFAESCVVSWHAPEDDGGSPLTH